jgi:hypothetical protein
VHQRKSEPLNKTDDSEPSLSYGASGSSLGLLLSELSSYSDSHQALLNGLDALSNFYESITSMRAGALGYLSPSHHDTSGLQSALMALNQLQKDDNVSAEKGGTRPSYLHELYKGFLYVFTVELASLVKFALEIEQRPIHFWLPGKLNETTADTLLSAEETQRGGGDIVDALGGTEGVPDAEDDPESIRGMNIPQGEA